MEQTHNADAAGNGGQTPHSPTASAASSPDGWSREEAEQALVEHLPMIQKLVATVARQHRLSADDAEEFSSTALLHMISDDYAVLRKFRGKCQLRTFLTVVFQRLCLDFRAAQWGKWRPALQTRRQGDVAILLERLIMRDGLTFDEAFEMLSTNHQMTLDRDTLARIHAGFRRRGRPRFVREDEIGPLPSFSDSPDRGLVEMEEQDRLARASGALSKELSELEPRDLLILQLRFGNRMVVADIGRLLKIDHKWIFRRIDRLMKTLRARLEASGIRADDIVPILGHVESEAIPVLKGALVRASEG
jgi:RNA polymerase sigma factor (sigma-70 family)